MGYVKLLSCSEDFQLRDVLVAAFCILQPYEPTELGLGRKFCLIRFRNNDNFLFCYFIWLLCSFNLHSKNVFSVKFREWRFKRKFYWTVLPKFWAIIFLRGATFAPLNSFQGKNNISGTPFLKECYSAVPSKFRSIIFLQQTPPQDITFFLFEKHWPTS